MKLSDVTISDISAYGWEIEVEHREMNSLTAEEIGWLHRTMPGAIQRATKFTRIAITNKDGMHVGYSFLSYLDNWDRRKGNKIALGRTLKNIHNQGKIPEGFLEDIEAARRDTEAVGIEL